MVLLRVEGSRPTRLQCLDTLFKICSGLELENSSEQPWRIFFVSLRNIIEAAIAFDLGNYFFRS